MNSHIDTFRWVTNHVVLPLAYVVICFLQWNQLDVGFQIMSIGVFFCLCTGIPNALLIFRLLTKNPNNKIWYDYPITIMLWGLTGIINFLKGRLAFKQYGNTTFEYLTDIIFTFILIMNTMSFVFIYVVMLGWGMFSLIYYDRIPFQQLQPQIHVYNQEGLTDQQLQQLTQVQMTESRILKDEPTCSICLVQIILKIKQLFTPECQLIKLDCNHSFHTDCIQTWLKQHNRCPYCRTSVGQHQQIERNLDDQLLNLDQVNLWALPQQFFVAEDQIDA